MTVIRALVVDDEPHARHILRRRLRDEPDVALVGECRSGREALQLIREHAPDLVFLDIRMPDLTGFQVLEELTRSGDRLPFVVFVTAYDEYALRAFEVHALAYLLKPFDDVRVAELMNHIRRVLSRQSSAAEARLLTALEELRGDLQGALPAASVAAARLERLVVRRGTRTYFVAVADVQWVQAEGNYARLHCGSRSHLVSRTMASLETALAPSGFVRIHRSALVNVARIRELRTTDHRDYVVVLEHGMELRLSRTYRAELERAIGSRL